MHSPLGTRKFGGARVSHDEIGRTLCRRASFAPRTTSVLLESDRSIAGDVSSVMVNETLGGVRAAGPRRETSHTVRHNKVPEDR